MKAIRLLSVFSAQLWACLFHLDGLLVGLASPLMVIALAACQPKAEYTVQLWTNTLQEESVSPIISASAQYQIGYDRRLEPKDDLRQLASLARWLESQTGYSFGILIANPNQSIAQALCEGKADFAVVGTVSYLQAHELCGVRIMVRGLNLEGKDNYRAAIVVSAESQLSTLSDLRGHSFAFGAYTSTQGHLIPRLMLKKAGVELSEFSRYVYTGSHTATANAVSSRQVDAGALQDTLALSLAQRGLLRILALSEPYPSSGIVVAPQVPAAVVEQVQQALLRLQPLGKDADLLYDWQRTEMPLGFVQASDADYQELYQIAKRISLLEMP